MSLDIERVRYWLGVGAQPTETVKRILAQVRVFHFASGVHVDNEERSRRRVCL